jgi:probable phosphoglycerate mutase
LSAADPRGDAVRLFVVRHGRTGFNAEGRVQGQFDAELDEVGRAQARRVAAKLAELKPAAIISSDLCRAADTAAELSTLTGLPVQLDQRLRERSFGVWQGMLNTEVAERYPEQYVRWQAGQPVDGLDVEAVDDVAKRTAAAFEDAAAQGPTVVVFGHGAGIRYALGAFLGWPATVQLTLGTLGNCRWLELRREPVRGWRLHGYNVG